MSRSDTEPTRVLTRLIRVGIVVALLLGAFARLAELDRSPFRADELNMHTAVTQDQSLIDLWSDPPWLNQIPSGETLAIVFARVISFDSPELTVRLPFALFGLATVLLCVFWIYRTGQFLAAFVVAVWMALNPFHIYESREAYYYVLLMFFSAGSALACIRVAAHLRTTSNASWRPLILWAIWTVLACHMHMSFWSFAAVQWLFLIVAAWRMPAPAVRKAVLTRLSVLAVLIGAIMLRWVIRALERVRLDAAEEVGFIGDELSWVLPRLFPLYLGGMNVVGIALMVCVLGAAAFLLRRGARSDPALLDMTLLLWPGFIVSLSYVLLVGGGLAKFSYFSAYWPLFMIWSGLLIGRLMEWGWQRRPKVWGGISLGFIGAMAGIFAFPAWHILHLDGKPTPYKVMQEELDRILPAGTVIVVDRWFEPWNEMATHAPTNVHVTFTVPDEPFEAYVQNQWREVTRRYLENGRGQAFLMLSRNHWERMGVWSWPQEYFARHHTIKNPSGLWLREHGFAPIGGFYNVHTNRLIVDLFYDLPEDRIERARGEGHDAVLLYGSGWDFIKPWRPQPGWPEQLQQIVWAQAGHYMERGAVLSDLGQFNHMPQTEAMRYMTQGQWADFRVPGTDSDFHLVNLRDRTMHVELRIVAAALSGPVRARVGDDWVTFPQTHMVERRIPLTLQPGEQAVRFSVQPDQLLLIYSADLDNGN